MPARLESSPGQNLAYAKEYARERYPNDKRLYLVFVAGAAFSEGWHFYNSKIRSRPAKDEKEYRTPEGVKIASWGNIHGANVPFDEDKNPIGAVGEKIAKSTETGFSGASKGDSPLDLVALRKAENSVDPDITDEAAEDEHGRVVAAKRFWGPRHEGPKGMDAINFLLNKGSGYVPAAWTRDDVGEIDLCWGDALAGLKHIIIRRKQTGQDLANVLRIMDQIIRHGKRSVEDERGEGIVLKDKSGRHRVVLSRHQGAGNRYVVTAFKKAFHR